MCIRDSTYLGRVTNRSRNHLSFPCCDKSAFQDTFTHIFSDRLALTSKSRVINKNIISRSNPSIGRNCISGFKKDKVSDNDIPGLDRNGMTVPYYLNCHIIPVSIEHIELFTAPVFVEKRNAG